MTCWLCRLETAPDAAPVCKNDACQACTAVADIDEEINQALATLRHLITKRCDLRSEQNRIHGSLRRLPVELKNYIFELVLSKDKRTTWDPIVPYFNNFNLTSICRSWRDIAWSNPSLWTTLRIVLGKFDRSCWIGFVHDRILRSQTLPLTLDIKIGNCSKEHLEPGLEPVLDAYHRVRRLRMSGDSNLALLNSNVNPETIEIVGVSLRLLQISWDNLTFANVEYVDLEDIGHLFRHAMQMTRCHVDGIDSDSCQLSPITHQRLKTFRLRCNLRRQDVAAVLLDSLTLPCLQEFHTNDLFFLTPDYLPALVHRSSCPLTGIIFRTLDSERRGYGVPHNLQPLPGVTNLYVEDYTDVMEALLLGEYFPNLRHLTCQVGYFHELWDSGVISELIVRNQPRAGTPNEGRLCKIRVQGCRGEEWISHIGMKLKELHANIIVSEYGFEILITEDLQDGLTFI